MQKILVSLLAICANVGASGSPASDERSQTLRVALAAMRASPPRNSIDVFRFRRNNSLWVCAAYADRAKSFASVKFLDCLMSGVTGEDGVLILHSMPGAEKESDESIADAKAIQVASAYKNLGAFFDADLSITVSRIAGARLVLFLPIPGRAESGVVVKVKGGAVTEVIHGR